MYCLPNVHYLLLKPLTVKCSFVSIGKNFDKDGDLVTWWDSKVTDVFNKKAECFVDQYSKFSFEHLDDIRASRVVLNIDVFKVF